MIIKLSVAEGITRQAGVLVNWLPLLNACLALETQVCETRCWGTSSHSSRAKASYYTGRLVHLLPFSHWKIGKRTSLMSEDLGMSIPSAPDQMNTLGPATALWSQCPAPLMYGNEVSGSPSAPTSLPQWKAKLILPSSSGHRCKSLTQLFWSETPLLLKLWKPNEKQTNT